MYVPNIGRVVFRSLLSLSLLLSLCYLTVPSLTVLSLSVLSLTVPPLTVLSLTVPSLTVLSHCALSLSALSHCALSHCAPSHCTLSHCALSFFRLADADGSISGHSVDIHHRLADQEIRYAARGSTNRRHRDGGFDIHRQYDELLRGDYNDVQRQVRETVCFCSLLTPYRHHTWNAAAVQTTCSLLTPYRHHTWNAAAVQTIQYVCLNECVCVSCVEDEEDSFNEEEVHESPSRRATTASQASDLLNPLNPSSHGSPDSADSPGWIKPSASVDRNFGHNSFVDE